MPVKHLSGGQKTRLMLARVPLEDPHLLLLDEPTNHLDIEMLEWLEDWLNRFRGAALIVSHDRAFLDNTVSSVLELDPATHEVKSYPGNYADYLEQKMFEREKQVQAWQDQQDEIAQRRSVAAHIRGLTKMKKGGKADAGGDKFAKGFFGNRATKNVAGRAKHIGARIEKLLSEDRVERPKQNWQMKLDFGARTAVAGTVAKGAMTNASTVDPAAALLPSLRGSTRVTAVTVTPTPGRCPRPAAPRSTP